MTKPVHHRLMICIPDDLRDTIQKTADEMVVAMPDLEKDLIEIDLSSDHSVNAPLVRDEFAER